MKDEIKEILKILKKCEFGTCITKHDSRVLLDYITNLQEETESCIQSYLSKDEFIEMIKNIKFEKVKSCELELITSVILDCKDLSKQILYKHIKID